MIRKMDLWTRMLLFFAAGLLTGWMLFYGAVSVLGRNGFIGSEILIIPLLLLTMAVGYEIRKLWFEKNERELYRIGLQAGYKQGRSVGYAEGVSDCYLKSKEAV